MTASKALDHRGFARVVSHIVPRRVFRVLTVTFNALVSPLPDSVKYPIGTALRQKKMPYSAIKPGDTVVQVGAPRDILAAGRSRAAHFVRLVGETGTAVVIEADPLNCEAFRAFVKRNGFEDRVRFVEMGLWSEPGELMFYSSALHPASNLLTEADSIPDDIVRQRQYKKIPVKVGVMDEVLAELGVAQPSVVSITTNGAELQILAGMTETLAKGVPMMSLAETGPKHIEFMTNHGFEYVAHDDRGYTFVQKKAG